MAIGLVASFFHAPLWVWRSDLPVFAGLSADLCAACLIWDIHAGSLMDLHVGRVFSGPMKMWRPPKAVGWGALCSCVWVFLAVLSSSLLFLRTLPFLPMFCPHHVRAAGLSFWRAASLKYPKTLL